jgi:hypothetical protein
MDQELSLFLSTFWSSQVQEDIEQRILDKETYDSIHNLVAASIIRNEHETRVGNSSLKTPSIKHDELPPLPKRWKQLSAHEYGQLFIAYAHKEIRNLESRDC